MSYNDKEYENLTEMVKRAEVRAEIVNLDDMGIVISPPTDDDDLAQYENPFKFSFADAMAGAFGMPRTIIADPLGVASLTEKEGEL